MGVLAGRRRTGLGIFGVERLAGWVIIENADATPPHLPVTLRLVRSDGVQGSLQVFAFGLLRRFL